MRSLVPALLVLAACGDSSQNIGHQGNPDSDLLPSCQWYADQWDLAVQDLSRSCDTTADCGLVGGSIEQTCDCALALPDHVVNREAYEQSAAPELYSDFVLHCSDNPDAPMTCDWGPPVFSCVDHACQISAYQSCLDPVDAGP